jgi:hypothetical protein
MHYKQQWANEMAQVFDKKAPNLDELIQPQTESQTNRARLLREKYKMDPQFMKEVDASYGPLEWRLPEAHAIYWAAYGLKVAAKNPEKVKQDDLITLRRVIYQCMLMSFQRGRLILNPVAKALDFGPNLEIIPKVSEAYEQAARQDEKNRDHILRAHKNFLKDAVYFLYLHNRLSDAAKWYNYLGQQYPTANMLDFDTNSLPSKISVDQYAVGRVQEDVTEGMARDRIKATLEGMLFSAFEALILGEDEKATGLILLAGKVRDLYGSNTKTREMAIGLEPIDEIRKEVLNRMLDPEHGLPQEYRALLRSKLGLAPEPPSTPAAGTNAVPQNVSGQVQSPGQ